MAVKYTNKAELEALTNALDSYGLQGYKIKEFKLRIRNPNYLLVDDEGVSLTGYWTFEQLNHFIMGYGKAFNKFNPAKKRKRISSKLD